MGLPLSHYDAKRSLGQNFFVNQKLQEKIISFIKDGTPNAVIEIGPGTGSFTKGLIGNSFEYLGIEIDQELVNLLSKSFETEQFIETDFLAINENLIKSSLNTNKQVTIFGSLPYNISKPIIEKISKFSIFSKAFLIIQKEVAEKYTKLIPKSNALGLGLSLYADAEVLLDLHPECFRPRPRVQSSLIKLSNHNKFNFSIQEKENLKDLIFQSFRNSRKKISNNLKSHRDLIPDHLRDLRAEDLQINDFIEIFDKIKNNEQK